MLPRNVAEEHALPKWLWPAVFVGAGLLWSIGIGRPVDLPNWHEFDYASIARNFVLEGNNILLPRIDWRGNGPGFTEMEFPIVPWIMAQLYRLFGVHEIIGRLLSLTFALLSLWVLRQIAMKVLSEVAAMIAVLFMVVNHELMIVATALQPESLMLFCYLLAVYCFIDWYQSKSWRSYGWAVCAFSTAMLVKSPAAHLAIFFFLWAFFADGWKAFRKPSLYCLAILSFAAPLIWYAHASTLWHHFHNSMGVSNEDHWLGLDILKRPRVFVNLIGIDLIYVLGVGGLLVILVPLTRRRVTSLVHRLSMSWLLAVGIYLVVIIRTAGANWATYYHVVAVPPVALLFGEGICQVSSGGRPSWRQLVLWSAVPCALLAGVLFFIGRHEVRRVPGVLQDFAMAQAAMPLLSVLAVLAIGVTVLSFSWHGSYISTSSVPPRLVGLTVIVGCSTYFFISSALLIGSVRAFNQRSPDFEDAVTFRSMLSAQGLIVASGGICQDEGGHRVANDAPNMFYWLDRKGFSTCQGQESISVIEADRHRGARYFVVERASLQAQPGLEAALRHSYLLLASGKAAVLFQLDQ